MDDTTATQAPTTASVQPAPQPDAAPAPVVPSQQAPDLSGLTAPATQPNITGTSEYQQATANEGTALQKANQIAQTPTAAPKAVPHAKLLAMVQGLSLGLDAFAKSAATHGREGGVQEVQEVQAQEQQQKIQAQQAAEAQKNTQIQQQLMVADTNHKMAQNILLLHTIPQDLTMKDLEVKSGQLGVIGQTQDIRTKALQDFVQTGDIGAYNQTLQQVGTTSGTPAGAQATPGAVPPVAKATWQNAVDAASSAYPNDPAIKQYNSVLADPKSTPQQMAMAANSARNRMSSLDAGVESKTKQNAAAAGERPKNLEDATGAEVQAHQAFVSEPTPENKKAWDNSIEQRTQAYNDRVLEAAQQARQTALATGKDVEAMIKTGVNPITKERLNLSNAPTTALVNTHGDVVPTDEISLFKPTQNEKQTADTARQVLAISSDLRAEIQKNPNIIGPLMGRDSKAMSKLGISGSDTQRLLNDVSLLQSAATKMHTGRFSNEILQKMGAMIGPQMNSAQFSGGLDSIESVANRYAKEDQLVTVGELNDMRGGVAGNRAQQPNQQQQNTVPPYAVPR